MPSVTRSTMSRWRLKGWPSAMALATTTVSFARACSLAPVPQPTSRTVAGLACCTMLRTTGASTGSAKREARAMTSPRPSS